MRKAVDAGIVAGAVAVGASEAGVVYEGAFGKANVQAGSPMSLDTVFWLLSMTKAFTATACMQLVEQGPFSDGRVVALHGEFERDLYRGLGRA